LQFLGFPFTANFTFSVEVKARARAQPECRVGFIGKILVYLQSID